MKDLQTIGTVTVEYSEEGKVVKAEFRPTMVVDLEESLFQQLESLKEETDPETLQSNADLVLAAWFSRSNEIELADREKWSIESSVIQCEKYPAGHIKKCVLEYTFKKRA